MSIVTSSLQPPNIASNIHEIKVTYTSVGCQETDQDHFVVPLPVA